MKRNRFGQTTVLARSSGTNQTTTTTKSPITTATSSAASSNIIQLRTLRECKQPSQIGQFISFLGRLVTNDDIRTITRRDQTTVELATCLISDQTERFLPVKIWGGLYHPLIDANAGDIILFHQFEMSTFRNVISATSKARSVIRVMNTTPVPRIIVKQEYMEQQQADESVDELNPYQSMDNKRQKLLTSSFQTAHQTMLKDELPQRTSNWSEIESAAKTLSKWSEVDSSYGSLYHAPPKTPDKKPPSSGATPKSSPLGGAATSSIASAVPTSLSSLAIGQTVTVLARLRSCHVVRHASANATTARDSTSSSSTLVAILSESMVSIGDMDDDGGGDDDDGLNGDDEFFMEIELHHSKWLDSNWRHFWHSHIGKDVRIEQVKVEWQTKNDKMILVDTPHTVVSSPALLPPPKPSFLKATAIDPPSTTPLHRAFIYGFELPHFPPTSRDELRQFLAQQSFPNATPPPLPSHLFSQLFYATCIGCGTELFPDSNSIYSCTRCLTTFDRASQLQGHPNDYRVGFKWKYREIVVHVQPESNPTKLSTMAPATLSLVLDHASISSLFGDIDPTCLIDSKSLLAAGAASTPGPSQPQLLPSQVTHNSGLVSSQYLNNPTQPSQPPILASQPTVHCSTPNSFGDLAFRFQWYRLLMVVLSQVCTPLTSDPSSLSNSSMLSRCQYRPLASNQSSNHAVLSSSIQPVMVTDFSTWVLD